MRVLLKAMKVSRSAYYAWAAKAERREKPGDKQGEKEASMRAAVRDKFYFHKRRYGSRRVSEELKGEGIKAGRFVVTRVMREEGLKAKYPKAFRPRTTDSRHDKQPSPNLLKDVDNTALAAGEAIVGDITYLPLTNGRFCYLAMFQDVRTKRIVGWSVSQRMTAELVIDALKMGLRRGFVKRNAIIHTDRGSQYASNEYRALIRRCNLRQSMSAKGNCYDNAQAESFFSRFAGRDRCKNLQFGRRSPLGSVRLHRLLLQPHPPTLSHRWQNTGVRKQTPKIGSPSLWKCGKAPKRPFPHSHSHGY